MTDQEIFKDRESKYGKPEEFFKAYGAMCEILDRYAELGQGELNYGHLSALKLVLLKVLRSGFCPEHEDSYPDMRNYVSIAEMCTKKTNETND